MSDHALVPKDERSTELFNIADEFEIDGEECFVGSSRELAYVGSFSLYVHEARAIRDWLNKVIPS